MQRPQRSRSAMRAPPNSAASTAVFLTSRRYATSRPCVKRLTVRESIAPVNPLDRPCKVQRLRRGRRGITLKTPHDQRFFVLPELSLLKLIRITSRRLFPQDQATYPGTPRPECGVSPLTRDSLFSRLFGPFLSFSSFFIPSFVLVPTLVTAEQKEAMIIPLKQYTGFQYRGIRSVKLSSDNPVD